MKQLCLILTLLCFTQPLCAFGDRAEFPGGYCPRTTDFCPLEVDCDRYSVLFIGNALMFSIVYCLVFNAVAWAEYRVKIEGGYDHVPDEKRYKHLYLFYRTTNLRTAFKRGTIAGILATISVIAYLTLLDADCCTLPGLIQTSAWKFYDWMSAYGMG